MTDPGLTLAVKDKGFVACSEVFGDKRFVIPKSVPVKVDLDYVTPTVAIEGNRPVKIDAVVEDLSPLTWTVVAGYYATEVGAVYLRREYRLADEVVSGLVAITAPDLGATACVPRPVNGKPLVVMVPPAFDPAPAETSCVAMSADGSAAAFKIWSKSTREGEADVPNTIKWFGPGPVPAINLSCLAPKCKPAGTAAGSGGAAWPGLRALPGCWGMMAAGTVRAAPMRKGQSWPRPEKMAPANNGPKMRAIEPTAMFSPSMAPWAAYSRARAAPPAVWATDEGTNGLAAPIPSSEIRSAQDRRNLIQKNGRPEGRPFLLG